MAGVLPGVLAGVLASGGVWRAPRQFAQVLAAAVGSDPGLMTLARGETRRSVWPFRSGACATTPLPRPLSDWTEIISRGGAAAQLKERALHGAEVWHAHALKQASAQG